MMESPVPVHMALRQEWGFLHREIRICIPSFPLIEGMLVILPVKFALFCRETNKKRHKRKCGNQPCRYRHQSSPRTTFCRFRRLNCRI